MPEGTVLTAITAIVGTLAGVIAVLWKKSEARWERYVEDVKLTHAAALVALQTLHVSSMERMAKQYEEQLDIAQADTRDYKDMLRLSIRSGIGAVEVGVEQARRLGTGGR